MHMAIIMDGNGRWAEKRGLRRSTGHQAGARAVRRIVEAAARSEVEILTLYAFSCDNWSRPFDEVAHLMRLFRRYLQSEVAGCVDNGIRIEVIGRRDRLNRELVDIIEHTEKVTADGRRLRLRLAVDYSARQAIARAAEYRCADLSEPAGIRPVLQSFAQRLAAVTHAGDSAPDVDLLLRTGGEQRLSDFLLWECAYAELVFVNDCWPDFDEALFHSALAEYRRRERRFGGLPGKQQAQAAGESR